MCELKTRLFPDSDTNWVCLTGRLTATWTSNIMMRWKLANHVAPVSGYKQGSAPVSSVCLMTWIVNSTFLPVTSCDVHLAITS